MILARSISADIQRRSGLTNSSRISLLIPSAHRIGVPMAGRFSMRQTEFPASAAVLAAIAPAGPPPTISISYLFFMHNLQCSEGTCPCTDAAGDALPLQAEIGINQLERILGTDCNAGAAVSTLISVYCEHHTHVVVVLAKTFMLPPPGAVSPPSPRGREASLGYLLGVSTNLSC